MLLPALSKAKDRAIRTQCLSNLKQCFIGLSMYGGDFNDKQPTFGNVPIGFWAWDLPWAAGPYLLSGTTQHKVAFCPGTKYSDEDNRQLWNWSPGNLTDADPLNDGYRVVGYALTLPSTPSLIASNRNPKLSVNDPVQVGFGTFVTPKLTEKALMADATITPPSQITTAQKNTYRWTGIMGGFQKDHLTAHLAPGGKPAGGNILMKDGHVEWRKFNNQEFVCRTDGGSPGFWW
jgi:hypothetical protein